MQDAGEFIDETDHTARRSGGSLAHPGEQDFTGGGAGRDERVVAETSGASACGDVFGVAVNFTHRRIEIDHEIGVAGTGVGGEAVAVTEDGGRGMSVTIVSRGG